MQIIDDPKKKIRDNARLMAERGASDEEIDAYISSSLAALGSDSSVSNNGRGASNVKGAPIQATVQETPTKNWGDRFMEGGGYGMKEGLRNLKDAAMMGLGGMNAIPQIAVDKATRQPVPEAEGTAGKVGSFFGRMAGELPLSIALGGAAGVAEGAIAGGAGKTILGKLIPEATTKLGAFGKAAISSVPQNVVTGIAQNAIDDPNSVLDPRNIAFSAGIATAGSIFSGFHGLSAFKNKLSTGEPTALATIPKIQEQYAKVGENADPNIVSLSKRVSSALDDIARGDVSPEKIAQYAALHDELEKTFGESLGKESSTLPKTEAKKPGTALVKKDHFDNEVSTSISRPGSGTQSVYPYVPPTETADPVAKGLLTKFSKSTDQPYNTPEFNEIKSKIDFGNEQAQSARLESRTILPNLKAKVQYKVQDFLRPVKEASAEAYDIATKFLRINRRMNENIDDALHIPDGNGEYTRGAESISPLMKALGSPEKLEMFQVYTHAKQAVMFKPTGDIDETSIPIYENVKTPFSLETAQKVITQLDKSNPELAQIYESRYVPLISNMVDMLEAYKIVTPNMAKALRENPQWAPLSRSIFGNANLGLIKERSNPQSDKLVGDLFGNLYSNIRSIVYNGERNLILSALAKARQGHPELSGHIEILAGKASTYPDINIPADTPESVRKTLEEAMRIAPKGTTDYMVHLGGNQVGVRLSRELASSLDQMRYRGKPLGDIEGAGAFENAYLSPLKNVQKTEKAISGVYSVYRDIFALGIPLDAIEAKMNAKYGFNLITDPIKGFKALYSDDIRMRDLYGHGAGLGFRFANPSAEAEAKTIEDLTRHAFLSKGQLRLSSPGKALSEFTGNLSNAVRAGAALRALEKSASYGEAATIYNGILGDPYKSGAATATLARMTAFHNYPIQATTQILSNLNHNTALTLARGASFLTAPTIGLWWLQKDDNQLRQLRADPQGRMYTFIRNPLTDEIHAIRKPPLYGALFQTSVEQVLDKALLDGDTESFKQMSLAILSDITPNVLPLTVNSGIALVTGQQIDPFRGTIPIVPASRANLLPEDQSDNASLAAKKISSVTGLSSAKVENIFRTFLLGTSYNAYQMADDYINVGKPTTFNQFSLIPGIRNVDPSQAGIHEIQNFYSSINKAQEAVLSLNKAENMDQPSRAVEIVSKHAADLRDADVLAPFKRDMDAITQNINTIKNNEMMTPDDKKANIDQMIQLRIMIARNGNKTLRQLR